MQPESRRPSIFISSTIRDLNDLRSAVRYFLEQFGFEVFTSEHADFPHGVTREAWRAGLEPIDRVDYYILIVGDRYGKEVDDGLSVTHHELRRARQRKEELGQPGMVFLIRRHVYEAVREKRELPDADNWPAIASLCAEIRTASSPDVPNWAQPFDDFRDVADALRASLRLAGPLRRRALEVNLIGEIESNARLLTTKIRDLTLPMHDWLPPAELPPSVPGGTVPVSKGTPFRMTVLYLGVRDVSSLRRDALTDALLSGEFLDFDPASGSFVAGPAQDLLRELRDRILALDAHVAYLRSEHMTRVLSRLPSDAREVSQDLALAIYGFRDAVENVALLHAAAHRWLLSGGQPVIPRLRPATPIPEEAERISAEEVTVDDARAWLLSLSDQESDA